MLDEPLQEITYLSIFITHFFGKPAENLSIWRKLYLDFDLSSYQISDLTGWPRTTISETFKREKIRKEKSKSPLPMYGERIVNRSHISNLGEQEIIKKILELKKQGLSCRAITKHLDNLNIPAKRNGKWNKTTVQAIIERNQKDDKCKQ